jgi:hypothetical protein
MVLSFPPLHTCEPVYESIREEEGMEGRGNGGKRK